MQAYILQRRQFNNDVIVCVSVDYANRLVKAINIEGQDFVLGEQTWVTLPLLEVSNVN